MARSLVAIGLFLPLLLLTVVPVQLAFPAGASPNPVPVMAMSLSPSGVTVRPSDYAPGSEQVGGTLSVDKLPGERLAVTITASVDTGWAAQCAPTQLVFTAQNKVLGFTAYVTAPAGTPANLVGLLRVEAHASGLSMTVGAVAQAIVTVAPFYKLYLDSPNPYKEVPPGSRLGFVLDVLNMGNSVDTFELSIMNLDTLASKGWTVSFSTASVHKVGALDRKSVRLFVLAPQTTTIYKAEGTVIMVQATSEGSREAHNVKDMIMPFVIYERGGYIDLYGTGVGAIVLMAFLIPIVLGVRWFRRRRQNRIIEPPAE